MVNLYFDYITDEIIKTAQFVSYVQKDTVRLQTPTVTLEVRYEKEAEETQKQANKQEEGWTEKR